MKFLKSVSLSLLLLVGIAPSQICAKIKLTKTNVTLGILGGVAVGWIGHKLSEPEKIEENGITGAPYEPTTWERVKHVTVTTGSTILGAGLGFLLPQYIPNISFGGSLTSNPN